MAQQFLWRMLVVFGLLQLGCAPLGKESLPREKQGDQLAPESYSSPSAYVDFLKTIISGGLTGYQLTAFRLSLPESVASFHLQVGKWAQIASAQGVEGRYSGARVFQSGNEKFYEKLSSVVTERVESSWKLANYRFYLLPLVPVSYGNGRDGEDIAQIFRKRDVQEMRAFYAAWGKEPQQTAETGNLVLAKILGEKVPTEQAAAGTIPSQGSRGLFAQMSSSDVKTDAFVTHAPELAYSMGFARYYMANWLSYLDIENKWENWCSWRRFNEKLSQLHQKLNWIRASLSNTVLEIGLVAKNFRFLHRLKTGPHKFSQTLSSQLPLVHPFSVQGMNYENLVQVLKGRFISEEVGTWRYRIVDDLERRKEISKALRLMFPSERSSTSTRFAEAATLLKLHLRRYERGLSFAEEDLRSLTNHTLRRVPDRHRMMDEVEHFLQWGMNKRELRWQCGVGLRNYRERSALALPEILVNLNRHISKKGDISQAVLKKRVSSVLYNEKDFFLPGSEELTETDLLIHVRNFLASQGALGDLPPYECIQTGPTTSKSEC